MARILALLLLLCTVGRAIAEDAPRVIIDEKRYADLLDKPYYSRILRVVFHRGYGHAVRLTEEEQADRRWFDEQGAKAFPVLLEVIKREPSPVDSPSSPEAWHGMARSRLILSWTNHFPEGEFQPLVEEVRRQVARLKGFRSPLWGHLQYLEEAFEFLAIRGDESDIPLMEKFLDDEAVGNRDSARGGIAKLKIRLEAEKAKQTSSPQVEAVTSKGANPDASGGNSAIESPGNASPPEKSVPLWLRWVLSFLVLAGVFWHWRWRAKRKNAVGGATK